VGSWSVFPSKAQRATLEIMGRLYLLVMVLVAGCGRLGFDGMDPGPGSGSGTANLVPAVCGAQSYTSIAAALDSDVSVAPTPTGAAVFVVPTSGGNLRGFTVDVDGNLTSGAAIKTVRTGGPFTASAATYVDNTLIAAVTSSGRFLIHIIPPDLSTYTEIGNIGDEHIGKNPLLHANADRITPTSCSSGMDVNPFDNAWTPQTLQLSVTTPQTTFVAATPLGSEALVAWSTADQCYVERLTNLATGFGSSQPWSCSALRLANDMTTTMSKIVFEATDGVRLGTIASDQLDGSTTLVAAGATSPRIAFDGTQYWISYLDASGTITAGTLQSDGTVMTTQVSGTSPQHDAYELAIVGGAPWIYSVDTTGTAASKLCLVPN